MNENSMEPRAWRSRLVLKGLPLLLGAVLLGGCYGVQKGIVSAPYIAGSPPPDTVVDYHRYRDPVFQVEGARVEVLLSNRLQTWMHEVWLFVVPVNFSRRQRPLWERGDPAHVVLLVTPEETGVWVRPGAARITIDGQLLEPSRTRLERFDRTPVLTATSTEWTTAAGTEFRLQEPGTRYRVEIQFDHPRPLPTQRVELDLSRVLPGLQGVPLTPIRFHPVRWRREYS